MTRRSSVRVAFGVDSERADAVFEDVDIRNMATIWNKYAEQ